MADGYYIVTNHTVYEDRLRWSVDGFVKPPGGRMFTSRMTAELLAKSMAYRVREAQPEVEFVIEAVKLAR